MRKISFRSYSKLENGEYRCFLAEQRGKAAYCGAAYPTSESRSAIACEKAIEISCDSFLRRPSLADLAMKTIAGFVNEGVYILQDPEKQFRCAAAFLYIYKGAARVSVSGNSIVFHFKDGVLQRSYYEPTSNPVGKSLRRENAASPEFDVSSGINAFLLCSGEESLDMETLFAKSLLEAAPKDETWADAVITDIRNHPCTAGVIILPERKGIFAKT